MYRVAPDTSNEWNPSRTRLKWITMTSEGENSGSFKQLRHGGEMVGTETKNIHTFCVQSNIQGTQCGK